MGRIFFVLLFVIFCRFSYSGVPNREMRGTWIATVANIDWPLATTTTPEKQKAEMAAILDNVVACNMNCVVFQARPTADAFYRSPYEPWSHWLTGKQGAEPGYDPLQFLIDECDKRGLAVHAWINPYRIWLDKSNIQDASSPMHAYLKYPSWTLSYGKSLYFNPSNPDVRRYICSIVADIVRRYDVDAVHIDDYFYPYKINGIEFPDEADYIRNNGGFTNKDDWRRNNVDMIVKQISDTIKSIKPWVEFGVSPFGIWRNANKDARGSATRGLSSYENVYADVLKWDREGWVDYLAPQVYWHIGYEVADYKILVPWWNKNSYGANMYIGQASYRIDPKSSTKEWQSAWEIARQVSINRKYENISGCIMYSAKSLANPDFRKIITENIFTSKSLVPENGRIKSIISRPPMGLTMNVGGGRINFSWTPAENSRRFVIYTMRRDGSGGDIFSPLNIVAVTGETSYSMPLPKGIVVDNYLWGITSLSPTHRESEMVYFSTAATGSGNR